MPPYDGILYRVVPGFTSASVHVISILFVCEKKYAYIRRPGSKLKAVAEYLLRTETTGGVMTSTIKKFSPSSQYTNPSKSYLPYLSSP